MVNDRLLLVAYEAQDVVDELRSRLDVARDPSAYVEALLEALREPSNGERREQSTRDT